MVVVVVVEEEEEDKTMQAVMDLLKDHLPLGIHPRAIRLQGIIIRKAQLPLFILGHSD